ncbi:hypothetical protein EVAR_80538_1 [Eumeta japonica]|uniref:Uncharacterized protein n=1 Tax=Eumeta variegata TaxID=151549 RepID=A0A4C1TNN5_EUMVA|nr:hypothetical protein EVAR_80538_1 [Eumeta japonica]
MQPAHLSRMRTVFPIGDFFILVISKSRSRIETARRVTYKSVLSNYVPHGRTDGHVETIRVPFSPIGLGPLKKMRRITSRGGGEWPRARSITHDSVSAACVIDAHPVFTDSESPTLAG